MKKNIAISTVIGMGIGFPVTLLCMSLIGGFNGVIREFLVWMIASALYGLLSGILFNDQNDLALLPAIGIHFAGCMAITVGAVLLNGYVTGLADVLPILIPALVIYAVITCVCMLIGKYNEKQINKALEEK